MNKDLYTKQSKIEGEGLFTKRAFKRGDIVFIAKGKLIYFDVKNGKDSLDGPNWLGISESVWLKPSKGNPFHYLNHSCGPNVGIKGKVTLVALCNIKPNEEITIDYSTTEGDIYWRLLMRCKCGSKNCRKTIRSIQFLPKKIFKTYLPYIPNYLQRVYNIYTSIKS